MECQNCNLGMSYYYAGTLGILFTGIIVLSKLPELRNKFKWNMVEAYTKYINFTPITYMNDNLTAVSRRRLGLVRRKTLILEMKTLISSEIKYPWETAASPPRCGLRNRPLRTMLDQHITIPYDFSFQIPSMDASVYIYKRPHVDIFLDRVSQWYNLVVITDAGPNFAWRALDYLDAGRNILSRRMYGYFCQDIEELRAKFLGIAFDDQVNVLLLEDSHEKNSCSVENAVRIKPFRINTKDRELLRMLPFLDALRFTQDVRSVLRRCTLIC